MGLNSIGSIVRRMSPPRYTVKEAAALVGRSPDTLVRWRKNGTYTPAHSVKAGRLQVFLYTDHDIKEMKVLTNRLKPGRKRLADCSPDRPGHTVRAKAGSSRPRGRSGAPRP